MPFLLHEPWIILKCWPFKILPINASASSTRLPKVLKRNFESDLQGGQFSEVFRFSMLNN